MDEIKSAKEENYIDDYNTFLKKVFSRLEEDMESDDEFRKFCEPTVNRLKEFIKNNKPTFYTVEVSS